MKSPPHTHTLVHSFLMLLNFVTVDSHLSFLKPMVGLGMWSGDRSSFRTRSRRTDWYLTYSSSSEMRSKGEHEKWQAALCDISLGSNIHVRRVPICYGLGWVEQWGPWHAASLDFHRGLRSMLLPTSRQWILFSIFGWRVWAREDWTCSIKALLPFIQTTSHRSTDGEVSWSCDSGFRELAGHKMWPASSPNLNPLDYYIKDIFETERPTNTGHKTKETLKDVIIDVRANMHKDYLVPTFSHFRSRIETEGDFIE